MEKARGQNNSPERDVSCNERMSRRGEEKGDLLIKRSWKLKTSI